MDVARIAWEGSGAPQAGSARLSGLCSRCGREGRLTPTRDVVSGVFTGYDNWTHPGGPGLCDACSWAYRTPELRTTITAVFRRPARCQHLDRDSCLGLLQCAIPAGMALVVPLRPGRKHLVPIAAWGMVCTDAAVMAWTAREAALLQLVVELRRLGFGSSMLLERSVPFAMMQRLPAAAGDWVRGVWPRLDPWRLPDGPWLPLALHVTMPVAARARQAVTL